MKLNINIYIVRSLLGSKLFKRTVIIYHLGWGGAFFSFLSFFFGKWRREEISQSTWVRKGRVSDFKTISFVL